MPRPIYESAATVRMAKPMASVAWTMTGGKQLGSRWWKMMRRCRLPTVRAASAYSISRMRSISPRMRRP